MKINYKLAGRPGSETDADMVEHPRHYTWLKDSCGVEVIDHSYYTVAPISEEGVPTPVSVFLKEEFKNKIMKSLKDSPIEVEIKDISSLKKGDVVKTLLGSMFYKIEGTYDYGFCIEENTVEGMNFIVSNEVMRNYFKKVVPFTEAVKEKQENRAEHPKVMNESTESTERVEHPIHYTWLKELCGIEVIDITRHLNFNIGNCVKYILRAGHKKEAGMTDREKRIEDLKKAAFYINDEIKRLQRTDEKNID